MTNVGLAGGPFTIGIDFDLTATGNTLGSYGATLNWDPVVFQFQSFSGAPAPFDVPVVNTSNVASGLLSFADADPVGANGRVNVLNVTFQVIAAPCLTTLLDLEVTSLFAAQTFTDLLPILQVQDFLTSVPDFFFDLRVTDPFNTISQWNVIAGAVNYDVIRGNLHEIFQSGGVVHLGTGTCLENDSLDTTTGAGTEPDNPDTEMPTPGQGFFYLIRFHDGLVNSTYGFTNACVLERIVDAGDCP